MVEQIVLFAEYFISGSSVGDQQAVNSGPNLEV